MRVWLLTGALIAGAPGVALAAPDADAVSAAQPRPEDGIPDQLDAAQRAGYRLVFQAIREKRWTDAQLSLDSLRPGPLHSIARAELYLAHGSPEATADQLTTLLNQAPELPQAERLANLASKRGAVDLPTLPTAQRLTSIAGASSRARAKTIKSDQIAADLARRMQPLVKEDRGVEAQSLLETTGGLTPEARTEWQQRVGWIYYLQGDDANARAMAVKAAAGTGEWAVQGEWVGALAAWRQKDCAAAGKGFEDVAARANDVELRAAGLFWASRADMVCARPDRIEARLKNAAQYRETFYGQLARQALGMVDARQRAGDRFVLTDWTALERRPNIRVAAALVEIGETALADQVIRRQAEIGDAADYAPLVRLTARLDLPGTTVWLSRNCPVGATAPVAARYPAPSWAPDGGWRVDRALVLAHTLQESRFRADVVSPAGAYGLMQIMPALARDYAKEHGGTIDRASLTRPSTNMEVGQRYLERLRDQNSTEGLLPKVIAAYNAGPSPVALWNAMSRDGGDPLLYIESIPFWETRGYVMTVLRNYWMYEAQTGKTASASRAALAQGMWPRFPGMSGPKAVRIARAVPRYIAPAPLAPALPTIMQAAATDSAAAANKSAAIKAFIKGD